MMTARPFLHLASVLAGLAVGYAAEPATTPQRAILVAPFENQSTTKCMVTYEVATNPDPKQPKRSFAVDRYSEAPRSYLENALVRLPGVTVVERQRVDAMLLESDFGAFSGLVDAGAATRLGKIAGANTIVMGTIMRVDAQQRTFRGYGVETRNVAVTATIRVRALDIASGAVTFSAIVEGTRTYPSSQFGGLTDSDVAYGVIADAMGKMEKDKDFAAAMSGRPIAPTPGTPVRIEIAPVPAGCDVLIDGRFRGNSPLHVELPSGTPVTIRFEKAGYQPWERVIAPGEIPSVQPTLQPNPRPNGQE